MSLAAISLTPQFKPNSAAKMAGLVHVSNKKSAPDVVLPSGHDLLQHAGTPSGHENCSNDMTRFDHFKAGVKNLAMIPLFPAIGYLGFDATGITSFVSSESDVMKTILGEGFGHAGLCFSLHFVVSAGYHLWKSVTG